MDLNPDSAQSFPEWPSDHWVDPQEERARLRQRLQRFRLGFGLIGVSLSLLTLITIGELLRIFRLLGPGLAMVDIPNWHLITGAIITWGAALGTILLCGPWPDKNWQIRSGILLLLNMTDAAIWTLQNAAKLGLYDGKIGHDWLLNSLPEALSWSEFALMATLAADASTHLGEPKAGEMSRSVRSLATMGAMVWFLYFASLTNWRPPIWPLRMQMPRPNPFIFMLAMSWQALTAIVLVQVTIMAVLANRCCGHALREMALADRANDEMPSRSEEGWDEMIRRSGPKDSS